jgi:transaldolase
VAAAAGATYIAPYLAKLQDAGRDGIGEICTMHELLAATGGPTRVLAASIHDTASVVTLAKHGIGCFTMAPAVAGKLFLDELTEQAAEAFEDAVAATST